MQHTMKKLAGATLFAAMSLAGTAQAQQVEDVKIGFAGPMTGAQAHYGKDFQNGIVLLNPQGFAATITIPAIYKRISGSQAPSVNNGAAQNVITLQGKDALVMIRR